MLGEAIALPVAGETIGRPACFAAFDPVYRSLVGAVSTRARVNYRNPFHNERLSSTRVKFLFAVGGADLIKL